LGGGCGLGEQGYWRGGGQAVLQVSGLVGLAVEQGGWGVFSKRSKWPGQVGEKNNEVFAPAARMKECNFAIAGRSMQGKGNCWDGQKRGWGRVLAWNIFVEEDGLCGGGKRESWLMSELFCRKRVYLVQLTNGG